MKKSKLIIFDLDGTLYRFRNGSFSGSGLQKIILRNALKFIRKKLKKTKKEAEKILDDIKNKYGEDISIAIEKEYGILRREYFDFVWNVDAHQIIEGEENTKKILKKLNKKYEFLLVSDGAYVWIQNALKELGVENLFEGKILSGDGNKRKSLGNRFTEISERYSFLPKNIVVVGDQEKTDIIPAKKLGFKTIFVNENRISNDADINLKNLENLEFEVDGLFS